MGLESRGKGVAFAFIVGCTSFAGLAVPAAFAEGPDTPEGGAPIRATMAYADSYPAGASTTADMTYHGGSIQKYPKVYLVFWGWQGYDPHGEADYLYNLFSGIGGSPAAATLTQYYETQRGHITNPPNQMKGYWLDDSTTPPNWVSHSQLEAEAIRAAAHFGYDRDANYFVVTPTGHSSADFVSNGGAYCAWHSWVPDSMGRPVAFTNFPYQPDAGTTCGAYQVNGYGLLDGVSMVAFHEYAETITDPFITGWYDDSVTGENGDKCAWIQTGQGAMANVALSSGTFPLQSTWSNFGSRCVIAPDISELSVTNLDSADPSVQGSSLTFTITVTNNGPAAASGVHLYDSFSNAFGYASGTVSQGSCAWGLFGTALDCTLGSLAVGGTATLTLIGAPGALGTITNSASASLSGGTTLDADPANSASVQSTLVKAPSADLMVTNVDSADPVLAGSPLTYTVTVTNNGPNTAPGVKLVDNLPAGVVIGTPTTTRGLCSLAAAVATCALGSLASGDSATLTFPVTPTTTGPKTNRATASLVGGGSDPVSANNVVSQSTLVNAPHTDLAVTNTDSTDPVLAGGSMLYNVTVSNQGPDDAPGVKVTDTLPPGVTVGSFTASQGVCLRASSTLTCTLGPLAAGANATITIPVTPTTAGTKTNTATASVTGGGLDPAAGNNRMAQATLVKAPSTDLVVSNIDGSDPVLSGDAMNYTVTVTNQGPDAAPSVKLVDVLPSGASYGPPSSTQGSCVRAAATATCLLGTLAVGESATVVFPVTPTTAGLKSNVATVSSLSGAVDPVAANNRASQGTTVRAPSADLMVTSTNSSFPTLGVSLNVSINVSNAGPDAAPAVKIIDALPAGMTFGSVATTQGTCTRSASTLTCLLGRIESGANLTIIIPMTPTTKGSKTTTATASQLLGGIDPNAANNRAVRTFTVS